MSSKSVVTLATLKVAIERLERRIIKTICTALGVEKLSDINLKIESATNDVPARISADIEAKLRDPGFIKGLAEAFASNEDACTQLNLALEQFRRRRIDEAADRRHENLTVAVTTFYAERDPNAQLSEESTRGLVELLDREQVVKGLRASQYGDAVAKAIISMEEEMSTLIAGLCKARTPEQVIESNAALLILEGIPLERKAVRARLEREEDIASCLRKT